MTQQCGWSVVEYSTCAFSYSRSSTKGTLVGPSGQPAFAASAQGVWSVHFERDGVAVEVPGAPTELEGASVTSAVEVAEIQTIITGH